MQKYSQVVPSQQGSVISSPLSRSTRTMKTVREGEEENIEFEALQNPITKQVQSPIKTPKPRRVRVGPRFDSFGIPILKGLKKHKVAFRNEVSTIVYVENWKSYNIDKQVDETCPCQLV